MINEKRFAESYNSFWNTILPLSASAVKNLKIISHSVNDFIEYEYIPKRRALINHFSFNVYKHSIKIKSSIAAIEKDSELIKKLLCLTQKQLFAFISKDLPNLEDLNHNEIKESLQIAENLEAFFNSHYKKSNGTIIANPKFRGCGIIKNCYGDILANKDLYEIKATKKYFEPKDIRQLLTYCALNFNNKLYNIENIGIYNPKVGLYFKININDLCSLASGNNSITIFNSIVNFASTYDSHN